jgi:DinB family protein
VDRQLNAIVEDLQAVEQRLRLLQDSLPRSVWCQPPAAGRWSPADCVAHLNLTSSTTLPLIREGLRDAANRGNRSASRYRRDVVGWVVWKLLAPSNRLRTRTIKAWVHAAGESPDSVMADFARLQSEMIACVREADRLPIDRVTLRSPFDARVTCNLYAALTLIPRHQQRHVLQAERAAAGVLGSEWSPVTV